MLIHLIQMIPKKLCVSQSVNWFTSLLKLDKWRDISSSGWDIFLKFFGDIPEMLLMRKYLNQLNLKIQFVSRSVWLLIYLLLTYNFRLLPVRGSYSNLFSMFIGLLHMWKIKFLVSLCLLICMFAYLLNFSVTSAFKFEYLNFIQMHLI